MIRNSHTLVSSPTVHSKEQVTLAQVPCGFPVQPYFNQIRVEEIEKLAVQSEGEFVQESHHFEYFLANFSDEGKQLGLQINEEIRSEVQCPRNVVIHRENNLKYETGTGLAGHDNTTFIGNALRNDSLQPKPRPTPPKSLRRSSLSPEFRRRREKANEREKQRVMVQKHAMNVLKNSIPAARGRTKITKLEILNLAQDYIHSLTLELLKDSAGEREEHIASTTALFKEKDLFVYCNYDSW